MSIICIPINEGKAFLRKTGEHQYACVDTGGNCVFGPVPQKALCDQYAKKNDAHTVNVCVVCPDLDSGLEELGSCTLITITTEWLLQSFTKQPRNEADRVCCLEERARTVRNKLVAEIQDLIENWSRRVRIAERTTAPELAALQQQLIDLEDFQQALCDLPAQQGFPLTCVWPEVPANWVGVSVSGVNLSTYYSDITSKWQEA